MKCWWLISFPPFWPCYCGKLRDTLSLVTRRPHCVNTLCGWLVTLQWHHNARSFWRPCNVYSVVINPWGVKWETSQNIVDEIDTTHFINCILGRIASIQHTTKDQNNSSQRRIHKHYISWNCLSKRLLARSRLHHKVVNLMHVSCVWRMNEITSVFLVITMVSVNFLEQNLASYPWQKVNSTPFVVSMAIWFAVLYPAEFANASIIILLT